MAFSKTLVFICILAGVDCVALRATFTPNTLYQRLLGMSTRAEAPPKDVSEPPPGIMPAATNRFVGTRKSVLPKSMVGNKNKLYQTLLGMSTRAAAPLKDVSEPPPDIMPAATNRFAGTRKSTVGKKNDPSNGLFQKLVGLSHSAAVPLKDLSKPPTSAAAHRFVGESTVSKENDASGVTAAIADCKCKPKKPCPPTGAFCGFCMNAAYASYWQPLDTKLKTADLAAQTCQKYVGGVKEVCEKIAKAVAGALGDDPAKMDDISKYYIAYGPYFGASAAFCRESKCCLGEGGY